MLRINSENISASDFTACKMWQSVIIVSASFLHFQSTFGCSDYDKILSCEIDLPKYPVAQLVTVVYAGYNRPQCVNKLYSFEWKLGIFCTDSHFCGLGLDLERNYFEEGFAAVPFTESCDIIVNKHLITCEEAEEKIYDSGIAEGEIDF